MPILIKKSLSLFFALTLLFSPLAAPFIAPKAEAQIGSVISGCLGGYVAGLINSFFPGGAEVPVNDTRNNIKECMDSIAYALAKTLLAQLTDSIINWINTGFDGNPFYIGDSGSFFKNVIRDELQLALDDLKRTGNIYFDIIKQEAIYKQRLVLRDQLGSTLDADIVRALCGYAEYEAEEFCSQQLTPESRYELTRAFTRGYIPFQWSTWESLTQNCGNNYFCSGTVALEYQLAQRQERLTQLNDTLNRSGGFLNQEVCKDPGFERDLADWNAEVESYAAPAPDDVVGPPVPPEDLVADLIEQGVLESKPVCRETIIRTPGRIIADKLTSNLGTSERQLELADELNESISAIFDALIGKLIRDGLASFKNNDNDFDEEGNYIGNDAYYQARFSENNGFDFEPTNEIVSRDPEACDAAGGIFDEELEVCVFDGEGSTGGTLPYPWLMEDGNVVEDEQGLASLIAANPEVCIQINETRIKDGAEPCLLGTANEDGGNGGGNPSDATFTISPSPLRAGSLATFTITSAPANVDFEIVYLLSPDTDPEFLVADVTDANGRAATSIRIPTLRAQEITIIVSFGTGDFVEQVVEIE